jgi:gamma-glutamyltranspeptidase/glutathione hydrolase
VQLPERDQEAEARGRASSHVWGNLQTVMWDKQDNSLQGGSDPRNPLGAAKVQLEVEPDAASRVPAIQR